jgi:glycosyltransferase involved in cell wall biosynthesis
MVPVRAGVDVKGLPRRADGRQPEDEFQANPAKQHVLMLLQNAGYPEDERVLREARTLRDSGYDVTVICPAQHGEASSEYVDGISVRRYPPVRTRDGQFGVVLDWAWAILAMTALGAACFVRRPFSIIHVHNPPDLLVLVAAPYKLLGCRFVYDHHDLVPEMYDLRFGGRGRVARTLLRAAERLSCRLADLVVEVNESHREIDRVRSGVPLEHSVVVRNGPDERMLSRPPTQPPLRDTLVIGYAGVIGQQDGVDVLIEALDVLLHEIGCRPVACVIAGDGNARADAEQTVARFGLESVVRFTGWLSYPEFIAAIEDFDIGVAPEPPNDYNRHSTLLKIMDYMALGRPVVSFDLPEHRVTAGDAATYADGASPRDLAYAIKRLLDDDNQRIALGRSGRYRAEHTLAWSIVSQPLTESYRSHLTPRGLIRAITRR